jgi:hypothetical protein
LAERRRGQELILDILTVLATLYLDRRTEFAGETGGVGQN